MSAALTGMTKPISIGKLETFHVSEISTGHLREMRPTKKAPGEKKRVRPLAFTVISEAWTQNTATELVRQVSLLNSNISNLVDAFNMLAHQLHEDKDSTESVHIVREMSLNDAKSEILDLFEKEDLLSFSEIAEKLSLSLETVMKVCEQLESSGSIEATN